MAGFLAEQYMFFWTSQLSDNWTGLSEREEDMATTIYLGMKATTTETVPVLMTILLMVSTQTEFYRQ